MMVDKFGRRPTFLASTAGMFVTFIFWTLTAALYEEKKAKGANYAMIAFIWIFNVCYALAWSGLLVGYSIEILPYKLRAKGLMILNVCIQAALCLNNYANPVAFKAFGNKDWKLYLIYTVCISRVSILLCRPLNQVTLTRSVMNSAGLVSNLHSSSSNTSRQRGRPSKSWQRLLMAIKPKWLSWTLPRLRRKLIFHTITRRRLVLFPCINYDRVSETVYLSNLKFICSTREAMNNVK